MDDVNFNPYVLLNLLIYHSPRSQSGVCARQPPEQRSDLAAEAEVPLLPARRQPRLHPLQRGLLRLEAVRQEKCCTDGTISAADD